MSSASPQIASPPVWRVGIDALRRALAFLDRARPLHVLAALIAVEWLITLGVALTVRHNGWLYYQGGDELWHYVTPIREDPATPPDYGHRSIIGFDIDIV